MQLANHKTKLVCTIGPASQSADMIMQMMHAGMNIARLNFSHGDFATQKLKIIRLRDAARKTRQHITIMADLPGPKIRIGELAEEPVTLRQGEWVTLTTKETIGNAQRIFVDFPSLPSVVNVGDHLFISDGNIKLEVLKTVGQDVECRVHVGGELRSRKGLNFPGINLNISAFTEHDRDCLAFALENGVDAIGQSFVETAADVNTVRQAAAELGHVPFIIAKIERAGALAHINEILKAADGIMVARGDLGVETPIERMAVVQKQLISAANRLGKPVITATQMLESMVHHLRPTRAEATDVANAILDGTDCVMLSEESAAGRFPVEAVTMLATIAGEAEPSRRDVATADYVLADDPRLVDFISRSVWQTVGRIDPVAVLVPTLTGNTARMVSRFKLPVWIAAVSHDGPTCAGLQFSYGVSPVRVADYPADWTDFARRWAQGEGLAKGRIVLIQGPSKSKPEINPRLEILDPAPPE